ncbi:MAG: hypothetical protein ACYCYK_02715 [Candidatus Dormibacteria bacterium]
MAADRRAPPHRWEFRARFRRGAFGWRSQPAILRIREAVSEIRRVARRDPVLAADGSVLLLAKLSPALERVDSSSGSIGIAVNHAIEALVPLISRAPATTRIRSEWLDQLWEAYQDDLIPYIESLGERWGELCASAELASSWADKLLGTVRMALSPDPSLRGHFSGISACLSSLYTAGRYQEMVDILEMETFWHYRKWAVLALAAMGRKGDAIQLAEACRGPWTNDGEVNRMVEEILISSGLTEEAYHRYGLRAHRSSTYVATFRVVARKYPTKSPQQVLADLVAQTPGEEGKWFAAAKEAGLPAEALTLARRSPCEPRTLTRAAKQWLADSPQAAEEAAVLALTWLARGHGWEVTAGDALAAYSTALAAADRRGTAAELRQSVRSLFAEEAAGSWLRSVLVPELDR